ncbi:MAG TPA: magnesium transporter CorA family protein [Candidatus Peribacteraceae bacterium]|nr:magnesium transporter CorA family protein [Candidatus Peribacteraceae bacterium]
MGLQTLTINGITWHHSSVFDEGMLNALQKQYDFHKLDIEDCMSQNERPKVESYDTYMFCVFHIPVRSSGRIIKEELDVFIGKDFIVTLHEGKIATIDQLWKQLKQSDDEDAKYFQQGTGYFLYKLMDLLFDQGFVLIEGMMKELRRIEEELFENEEGINILRDILTLKRNIITMRSILFPQRSVITLLPHKNRELVPQELDIYFDDIHDAIERQWSMLDMAKEMSEALQDTHESWLSHRTNSVIRVLTIFSVTMLPLTFLTGLYGMNVPLPYQGSIAAFPVLIIVMVLFVTFFIGYLRRKQWL